jgi:hypothetical protein
MARRPESTDRSANERRIFDARDGTATRRRGDLGRIVEPAREIPVFATTDILVVGGGPAGTTAAVAAARLGADVILTERYNHLGGLSTGGLVVWIDRMSDWNGEHIIQGLAAEIIDRLPQDAVYGPPKGEWGSRDEALSAQWQKRHAAFHGTVTWAPMIDPEWLKLELMRMVREAGVDLLLHSWVAAPLVEDGRVAGAILESKQGRMAIRARVVIDTTGDGDIFSRAGEAYDGDIESDDIHHTANTASMLCGVDVPRWLRFQDEAPDAFRDFMRRGREQARHFVLPFPGWRDDVVVFMGPRFAGFDVLKVDDLTTLETLSRESLVELLNYYRGNAPGFENAWIMLSAPQLGARHSRRLVGRGRMTGDRAKTGAIEPDEIGVSPSLNPNLPNVSVPYGALLPRLSDSLLVAGRHISTDAQTHTYMREIPQCWLTGHAAGVAAALSVQAGVAPKDVSIAELQATLVRQGAHLRSGGN